MLCSKPFFRFSKSPDMVGGKLAAVQHGCGQCLNCRINHGRVWTQRLLLENYTAKDSMFITLTYEDEKLPKGYHVSKDDWRKFIKRYRRRSEPAKLRFYAVGEYGNRPMYRPHYHAFIYSDSDLDRDAVAPSWGCGHIGIGDVTKESASYLVGYLVNKTVRRHDPFLDTLKPEFMSCSKMKGGIGFQSVKKIAESLIKNKHWDNQLLRTINQGKQPKPLGRYLFKKMAEELNTDYRKITESYWENHYENYGHIEENAHSPGDYMRGVLEKFKSDRLSQEAKFKIHRKGKSI